MARILVVDDDALFLRVMRSALELHGHSVACVSDGASCRAHLAQERFSAMVCDIFLGGESGLQLMRDVRADYPDLTIIAISGGTSNGRSVHVDVLEIARETSANAVVKKPIEPRSFAAAVDQAMAAQRPRKAARA
jgi:CheY-like chemotaxis protein